MKWLMGGLALALIGVMASLSIPTAASEPDDINGEGAMTTGAESAAAPEGSAIDALIDAAATEEAEDAAESENGDAAATEGVLESEEGGAEATEDFAESENGDDAATEDASESDDGDGEATAAAEPDAEGSDDATAAEDGADSTDAAIDGESDAAIEVTDEGDTATDAEEPGFLDDGDCTLGELWLSLDAILAGPSFPERGADVLLPVTACEELVEMVESATANMEDAPTCTLADVINVVDGLDGITGTPEVELPSQLCMSLFGSIGTLREDIPVIFAGAPSVDGSGSTSVEPEPIVVAP